MRAEEFITEYKDNVVQFKQPDTRTDDEKYDDAVRDQRAKNWKYDPLDDDHPRVSDEELENLLRKAGMFDPPIDEGNAKNADALVGSGLGGNTHKPNKDSKYLKSVRTPTTNYPVDRKRYNNGAKPGANPGFVGG